MILFGSSLFLLYALPHQGAGSGPRLAWTRQLLAWSAFALLAATLAGLVAQTAVLAGSVAEGLKPDSLWAVVTTTSLGPSSLIRAAASLAALIGTLTLRSGRRLFWICTGLGAVVCASFAWMGHGASTEGAGGSVHLVADILHGWAAGVWIGALVMFFGLLRRPSDDHLLDRVLHQALHGFAGVGSALVAVLIATGLVNSWFLVGPTRILALWTSPYGQLLSLKLVLFVAMLGLAAINRFRLTPALANALELGKPRAAALGALRRSLIFESSLALAILALVVWFGALAPVSAQ